jgi:hypothetical protein
LRDHADKCQWHANAISDAERQVELRKLADKYIVRAVEIETKELGVRAPALEDHRARP